VTAIVFDPLVFDFAFDVVEAVPVLFSVLVEPHSHKVAINQDVTITAIFIDATTTPGRSFRMAIPEIPRINVYNPNGSLRSYNAPMVPVATGEYRYVHASTIYDVPGPYSIAIAATNGDRHMRSNKMVAFVIQQNDYFPTEAIFDLFTFDNGIFDAL
jgi:hypothetical protein